MKKLLIPIIALISINGIAQKKSNKEIKGDKYAFVYSFDKAIDSYTHAKKLTVDGQRSLAKSYSNIDQNIKSELAYTTLINMPGGNLPEDYYNYAMVLKANGKYDEANKQMDKFYELKPNDLRAKDYTINKTELINLAIDDSKYKIEHLSFNTAADDYGASYFKDKIVFASSGVNPKPNQKTYNWNGKPFLDMYVSELEGDQLKTAQIFDKSFDGKMHDGPASFNKEGTLMAFTKNNYDLKKRDKVVRIQICFSNYKDGKWSAPEAFTLNNKDYSVGHPCLTADGNTMYFSSDMPGGFGGVDIYKISKDDKGTWGKAENLGNKINTEGDEMFPFYEETNKVLFFSSNGHLGLGGLDIFMCAVNEAKYGSIHNAGYPLNTQYDDFSMIVNDKLSKGYFSSNRIGGSGENDIYAVDLLKLNIGKKIEGIAKENNQNPVPNSFITLFDEKGIVIDTLTSNNNGAFAFLVDSDKNFKLTGNKLNYLEGSKLTNSFSKEFVVKADVILTKKEEIVVQKMIVGADLGKILELKTIYYDVDKFNIRPDAEIELGKIIKTMNENPDMHVELHAYADCRASMEYNQILSDKRAKVSAWYIKARITKPERIHGIGSGETNLVSGCACEGNVHSTCSDEEFQKDRRTEFIIKKTTIPVAPLLTTD
jgi:outer membrane protein OmpA-like peptidoglycan-associated protein